MCLKEPGLRAWGTTGLTSSQATLLWSQEVPKQRFLGMTFTLCSLCVWGGTVLRVEPSVFYR